MLAGLGHDGLVGRDDQQHRLDPAGSRQHVAHEALVPGHVHEGEADAAPLRVREAEVDGDPAPLLLRQSIGVDSGQRLDQGRFAVVDVPRRADQESPHGRSVCRRVP